MRLPGIRIAATEGRLTCTAQLPAEGFGKDQKIAESNGAVPVQIKRRIIPHIALIQPEIRGELQKVGEVNGAIAIEVRIGGLWCNVR